MPTHASPSRELQQPLQGDFQDGQQRLSRTPLSWAAQLARPAGEYDRPDDQLSLIELELRRIYQVLRTVRNLLAWLVFLTLLSGFVGVIVLAVQYWDLPNSHGPDHSMGGSMGGWSVFLWFVAAALGAAAIFVLTILIPGCHEQRSRAHVAQSQDFDGGESSCTPCATGCRKGLDAIL